MNSLWKDITWLRFSKVRKGFLMMGRSKKRRRLCICMLWGNKLIESSLRRYWSLSLSIWGWNLIHQKPFKALLKRICWKSLNSWKNGNKGMSKLQNKKDLHRKSWKKKRNLWPLNRQRKYGQDFNSYKMAPSLWWRWSIFWERRSLLSQQDFVEGGLEPCILCSPWSEINHYNWFIYLVLSGLNLNAQIYSYLNFKFTHIEV